KTQPATKLLGLFLNSAAWLGKGKRPTVVVSEPQPPTTPEPAATVTEDSIEEDAINPAAKEKITEAIPMPAEEKISQPVLPLAAEAEEPTMAAKEKISETSAIPIGEGAVSSLAA